MDPGDGFKLNRRQMLAGSGALLISFSLPLGACSDGGVDDAAAVQPPLMPDQLDSYLKISEDGSVTVFFGKMDMGQGVDAALAQIVADELDIAFERIAVVMSDTASSVDQGGASGSTGLKYGAIPIRYAAAEARRILVEKAALHLGVESAGLEVENGVVRNPSAPDRQVSYQELLQGQYFNHELVWNQRYGNFLSARGIAEPKDPSLYKVVGTSMPRLDVRDKVLGQTTYITDLTLPGMKHGRIIRPAIAGARPKAVDEDSIKDIQSAQVVWIKDLLAVVADDEWDAVRAAENLRVEWSETVPPFPEMAQLYDHIRQAPVTEENAAGYGQPKLTPDETPARTAIEASDIVVDAEYEHPFQSHACMGPACAVADVRPDKATIWTGSQKAHMTRAGVARILELPEQSVRGIWLSGPGSYGRNDAGDAAMEAALLSRAVGAPVRVQGMRHDGHGWDPKGPASVISVRAGLTSSGTVAGYIFKAKGFSAWDMRPNESDPSDTLAGLLTGWPKQAHHNYGTPSESYDFSNKLKYWQTIEPLLNVASPLRTAHFRDPQGPQIHFASESFIDEMAFALGEDPVAFRLRHLADPRDSTVVSAAAETAGWQARTAPRRRTAAGGTLLGQGIGYASRAGTTVAMVAEIEIDPKTGRIWARKFIVAHDCGLIVNPKSLEQTIEGNVIQALSRILVEEVQFNRENVTSTDWVSYPILEARDVPEAMEIILINRTDLAPSGAGEPATRVVAPAIANAVFDATGVRYRRAPLTPERILEGLSTRVA